MQNQLPDFMLSEIDSDMMDAEILLDDLQQESEQGHIGINPTSTCSMNDLGKSEEIYDSMIQIEFNEEIHSLIEIDY